MNATTEQVFIEALSLPSQARAELAHKLIASLGETEPTPDIAQAWAKEARDRYEAFQRGEISGRNSEDVMRELYQRYK
jgi:hypothetical protein